MTAERIRAALTTIDRVWDDMLVPTKRGIGPTVHMQPKSMPPTNIFTLSLRRWSCEQVASMCLMVIDENDLTKSHVDGSDMHGMVDFLSRWVEWLDEHEASQVWLDELEHIARRCNDVAEQISRRRFKVAPCIGYSTSDMGERVECQGTLIAYLSSEQDLLPGILACDTDPDHAWTAGEWHLIGRRLGRLDPVAAERLASYIRGA